MLFFQIIGIVLGFYSLYAIYTGTVRIITFGLPTLSRQDFPGYFWAIISLYLAVSTALLLGLGLPRVIGIYGAFYPLDIAWHGEFVQKSRDFSTLGQLERVSREVTPVTFWLSVAGLLAGSIALLIWEDYLMPERH